MKRLCIACALVLALALPAQAEVMGVYGGIKIIDSIQSTGNISKTNAGGLGIDEYSQNTIGGGVFAGYDFYPAYQVPMRVELEYAIRGNSETTWDKSYSNANYETKGKYGLQTVFFNAYWDFHNSTAFTPYIGAGLGMGFIDNKYTVSGNEDGQGGEFSKSKMNTVFAWNVGLGASYAFTENISADLAYRFVGLGENEVSTWSNGGDKIKLTTHPYANEFSLGLRFTF